MTSVLNFSERLTIVKCVFCTDKAKDLLNEFPSPIVGRNRQFLTLLSANDSISLKICSEVLKKVDLIELMDAELIGVKAGSNVEHCLGLINRHNASLQEPLAEDTMLERANLVNTPPLSNNTTPVSVNEVEDSKKQPVEPDPLLQIASGMFND